MGVLQLVKLVELLNAGDLQRCGCAEVDLREFFMDLNGLRRVKTTPGRYSSSQNLDRSPQKDQPQKPRYTTSAESWLQKPFASAQKARERPISDDEDTVSIDVNEVDDEREGNEQGPQVGGSLGLGPVEPPAKNGYGSAKVRSANVRLREVNRNAQKPQPISWELPPLAVPAPSVSPMGTSLWCASRISTHTAVPTGIASVHPFSSLLCQAISDMAQEAHLEHIADAAASTLGSHKQSVLPYAPQALNVPRTRLVPAASKGKAVRKLSVAELWLGPEPSA